MACARGMPSLLGYDLRGTRETAIHGVCGHLCMAPIVLAPTLLPHSLPEVKSAITVPLRLMDTLAPVIAKVVWM